MDLDDVLRELRQLNQPVPKPLRLPSPTEVDEAERLLGVSFNADYRKFLVTASDVVFGTLEPCTVTGGGHTDLVKTASRAWNYGVPRDLLPVCEDNGDYYCMRRSGEVVYWSHNGASSERWADLATWIRSVWIEGH